MNPITWVEIPVSDMERAVKCYNTLFGWDLKIIDLGDLTMAWFPNDEKRVGASGTLILQESYVPSQEGALVYFESDDVQIQVDRFASAGCSLIKNKSQISPDHGYMAAALDSEGNRIAFHSIK
jgi:predicted enzyme related to lactoylglutathione lyase